MSMVTAANGQQRRAELAAFLRSRRERISPEQAGLAPGTRRRTPGLRREEVAQLAGVGVTWYTWLEQGRQINASTQVLGAVARTLRLDPAEREHLFRLADVPDAAGPPGLTAAAASRSRPTFSTSWTRWCPCPPACSTSGSTCSPGTPRMRCCGPPSSAASPASGMSSG